MMANSVYCIALDEKSRGKTIAVYFIFPFLPSLDKRR